MKLLLGVLILVSALFWLMVLSETAGTSAPEPVTRDPLWVIRTFNDTLNSRNVDAALALFADPFIFTDSAGQMSSDRDLLRGWLWSCALREDRSEISDIWLRGDTVTWAARVFRGSSLFQSSTALVQDGKIVSLAAHRLEQHSPLCAIAISETSGIRIAWCADSETLNVAAFDPTDFE